MNILIVAADVDRVEKFVEGLEKNGVVAEFVCVYRDYQYENLRVGTVYHPDVIVSQGEVKTRNNIHPEETQRVVFTRPDDDAKIHGVPIINLSLPAWLTAIRIKSLSRSPAKGA